MREIEYDSAKRNSIPHEVLSLFSERDLIWLLVKREIVSRYRRSILGIAWSLVTPMAMATVLYFVLSEVFKTRLPGGSGYAAFLMSGLLVTNLLNQGATSAGFSYSANAGIITKIRTHILIFPLISVLSSLINFLLGIIPLAIFILLEKRPLKLTMLLIPMIGLLISILILGIGLHVASLAARYQDIHGIMAVIYTILGYATPIIYPLAITKGLVRQVINLNPLTNFVELIRGLTIDKSYIPSIGLISYSIIITLLFFLTGVIRARNSYSVIVEGL